MHLKTDWLPRCKWFRLALLPGLMVLAACASERVATPVPLQVSAPEAAIPESSLLDVAISIFDPILDAGDELKTSLTNLRHAESHYLSWQMAQSLQASGYWGAIRVNPFMLESTDLNISGTLLQSDGETLHLRILAVDAMDRVWLDRAYLQVADTASETVEPGSSPVFPFEALFNRIANDLSDIQRNEYSASDLAAIREYALMRFGAAILPELVMPYYSEVEGQMRLPPVDDPLFVRLAAMRERNDRFLDAVQGQYAVYAARIDAPYRRFLARSARITDRVNQVVIEDRNDALNRTSIMLDGVSIGNGKEATRISIDNLRSNALNSGNNAGIYAAALAVGGESFEMEVRPQTLRIEERTVNLSGSIEEQYAEWRGILEEFQRLEVVPDR